MQGAVSAAIATVRDALRLVCHHESMTDQERRAFRRGELTRWIAAASVVAICGSIGSAATAEQRQALCKLVVNGKSYIDGRCDFEVIDSDGSFVITGKPHFAYVMVKGNTAEASWNEDPKALHAHWPLGTLTRRGACWENAAAQICARGLQAGK